MHKAPFYLFVYGSLRSGFHHPAYNYIAEHFDLVGAAKVKGVLYDMGEYPAAQPAEDDQFIIGELYRIKNEDEFGWAIAQLDDYEGLVVEEQETPLYRRATTTVYINNEEQLAWIYWYNGSIEGRPVIESGDVLEFRKQKNQSL